MDIRKRLRDIGNVALFTGGILSSGTVMARENNVPSNSANNQNETQLNRRANSKIMSQIKSAIDKDQFALFLCQSSGYCGKIHDNKDSDDVRFSETQVLDSFVLGRLREQLNDDDFLSELLQGNEEKISKFFQILEQISNKKIGYSEDIMKLFEERLKGKHPDFSQGNIDLLNEIMKILLDASESRIDVPLRSETITKENIMELIKIVLHNRVFYAIKIRDSLIMYGGDLTKVVSRF